MPQLLQQPAFGEQGEQQVGVQNKGRFDGQQRALQIAQRTQSGGHLHLDGDVFRGVLLGLTQKAQRRRNVAALQSVLGRLHLFPGAAVPCRPHNRSSPPGAK